LALDHGAGHCFPSKFPFWSILPNRQEQPGTNRVDQIHNLQLTVLAQLSTFYFWVKQGLLTIQKRKIHGFLKFAALHLCVE
jgi:hypothetical protein